MLADLKQHQQLCIFQLLFRLDVQRSASILIFSNSNSNQQQFRADEYKIPAQQKADNR
jgi:hypothetical protein